MRLLKNLFLPVISCVCFFQVHAQSNRLRILSYNVRNAKGMDGQVNYDRVASVIKEASPTVVALQELDSATVRSGGKDVLKEIAGRVGMEYSFGASIDFNGGKYGIGILSQEKPLHLIRIPLPGKEEKRSLLIAEFHDYFFCCTHFSLTPEDQVRSAKIINEQIDRFDKPVYLAGDFNSMPDAESIRILSDKWHLLSGKTFTFPSDKPDRCIDYIFTLQKRMKSLQVKIIPEAMASDHRPVFVEVRN